MACQLVVDMLTHLESQTMPKVIGYFADSTIMQLLLTSLGAFKDNDALRADNYQQMMRRKWRSSEVSPFATNLAVIKYGKYQSTFHCISNSFNKFEIVTDCPHDNERSKIMFFLNQKPLDFNWCNVGLCDWSKVQQMYSSFKQRDCLTTYCTEGSASSIVPVFTIILFAVAGSIFRLVV